MKSVKIYTKTGDYGTTSLFGGSRLGKNSARITVYGDVDELNSLVGVILSENPPKEAAGKLSRIQAELFVLGSDLAAPFDVKVKIPRIAKSYVLRLEREIDLWTKKLTPLKNFVLPGGSDAGSKLHLARAVARRAERSIVELAQQEKINKNDLLYINRLSDWLFTLARYVNLLEGEKEISWKGRG